MQCVVCGSPETSRISTHRPSISSDRRVFDVAVENRLCASCGAVFNGAGARAHEAEFYTDQYDLHGESERSEWQVYAGGRRRDESSAILDFLHGAAELPAAGSVLEIGCGKGVLLARLLSGHPGWTAAGIEPSRNAAVHFRRRLPEVAIHEGLFETSPFRHRTFDLVAASGVLEHVPDPVAFLRRVRSCIAPGGLAYLGVPNFELKPDDLLVFDHLNRLTPASLDTLYRRVGFELHAREARPDRIWLWDLIRPTAPATGSRPALPGAAAGARLLAGRHLAFVERATDSFARLLRGAVRSDALAVYGLGALGLLELHKAGSRGRAVRCLLDDNPHLLGSRKHGLEIHGSEAIPRLGINKVFLSANPCYHPRMRARLASLGVAEGDIHA